MDKSKILVVDDGITVRLYYRDVLNRAGFHVDEAANGVEGLEKALLGRYNLILADINMPKMDGYEFVRQVRNDPALQTTPIITITTEAEDADVLKAYEAGANFYMVKPVKPDQLVEAARLLTGEPVA
jgi:two-component system chemotaxis response regulator CheY